MDKQNLRPCTHKEHKHLISVFLLELKLKTPTYQLANTKQAYRLHMSAFYLNIGSTD